MAFDAHKPRSKSKGGCQWPEDAPLIEFTGTCKISDDQTRVGVTIYGSERGQRAREYFQGKNGRQTPSAKLKEAA